MHEVKFDGYRIQAHKTGKEIALFSKSGRPWTSRYPLIAQAAAALPTRSVILDAELTACDLHGWVDFEALLHRKDAHLCIWVFDILLLNGRDLRPLPLEDRREKLDKLMARVPSGVIRRSELFPDAQQLLSACEEHKMEGIVSKRMDAPYTSGPSSNWIKVKCPAWRAANQWRHELFARN
jgi:bifunctional non-homologous end joining protein LigD